MSGGVFGQPQQGDYEIYSKTNKLYAGESAAINAPNISMHARDRYDTWDGE